MNLMDLLKDAGAENSVGTIGKQLNLGGAETKAMIDAVAPALMRGLQKGSSSSGGLSALARALQSGNHQAYVDRPDEIGSSSAIDDGKRILGHVFGSKDVSRNVAADAAAKSGVDASLIKQALPMIAGLAMGALSKKSNGGRDAGSVLPGLLGGGDGDFGVDDVLNLARKFF